MQESSGLSASPWSMDAKSWLAVFESSWKEAGSDNIGLIAAGVSFYGFLAIVPLLGAIVLSYVIDRRAIDNGGASAGGRRYIQAATHQGENTKCGF